MALVIIIISTISSSSRMNTDDDVLGATSTVGRGRFCPVVLLLLLAHQLCALVSRRVGLASATLPTRSGFNLLLLLLLLLLLQTYIMNRLPNL